MSRAFLALGANVGEPRQQLAEAVRHLDAHPRIEVTMASDAIETEPWGNPDQPRFLNMAIEVETALEPMALLDACLTIEAAMGRERLEKWGPRIIDIDVIAYGRERLRMRGLTVPHPHAHERDFVLTPLRQIAPDMADWIVETARDG